jgi:Mn-dependent DtxR family transcriptional regulator
VKRHTIIVQGKGSERCRERIYAFPTKEEEKPHGKEKGTDKEESADKDETLYKEESTGKET